MQSVKKFSLMLLFVLFVTFLCYKVIENYSFIFAKTVTGEVIGIEHAIQQTAIISGGNPSAAVFSVAVLIKQPNGELFSASSEDRQWAVVKPGYCVEAKFYPYPPWALDKAGTYSNARLTHVHDCKDLNIVPTPPKDAAGVSLPKTEQPSPPAPAAAAQPENKPESK
jgi:hypothetical protein